MTALVTFVIKYWRGTILEEPHQDGACRKEETTTVSHVTSTSPKLPVSRYTTANMESGLCFPVQNVPSSFRQSDILMNISVLIFLPRSEVMPNVNPVARNSCIVDPISIT